MLDGEVKGFIVVGENPAVGSANGPLHRRALANLDWLVVRDLVEIETRRFWYDSPEVESRRAATRTRSATEVFFLPAAAHIEKDGSFTNTQRLLQWHHKAVEPPGDCRSDLWFYYHLGRLIREKLAGSDGRARPAGARARLGLPDGRRASTSRAPRPCCARSTAGTRTARRSSLVHELKDDGSTTCGCWIYCGCFADETQPARPAKAGHEQTLGRARVGLGLAGEPAHPLQPRLGRPRGQAVVGAQALRLVGRAGRQVDRRGRARLPGRQAARLPPARRREGPGQRSPGTIRSSCRPTGGAGCSRRPGVVDGPLPTHYEPHESPFRNPLYSQRVEPRPAAVSRREPLQPDAEPGAAQFPFVFTTYRLTEHHTAGGMSRSLPFLAELQPEMFCEVSPELAAERGSSTAAGRRSAPARGDRGAGLVTERMRPLTIAAGPCTRSACPTTGVPRPDDGRLGERPAALVLDPNVHIQESKAATCDIRPGRRPRGTATECGADEHADGVLAGDVRRRGAAADGLLHRHERLHRLQGLRGGVQGVERRARGRARLHAATPTTTPAQLGANTWRHVAFIEQTTPLRMEGDGGGAEARTRSAG